VHVGSAGLRLVGEPASANGVDVLADRGIDLREHRSRILDRQLLEGTDLVLAMSREHLREAVLALPEIWPRAFTLKELVRRGDLIGRRAPGESIDAWLSRAHLGRNRADLLGSSSSDDIDDPIGLGRSDYEKTADEISGLVDHLVDLLWSVPLEESA